MQVCARDDVAWSCVAVTFCATLQVYVQVYRAVYTTAAFGLGLDGANVCCSPINGMGGVSLTMAESAYYTRPLMLPQVGAYNDVQARAAPKPLPSKALKQT